MIRYHSQLTLVSAKFPIDEEHVRLLSGRLNGRFKFSFLGIMRLERKNDCVIADFLILVASSFKITFEQSSILFNIASMYSQLATAENVGNEEGLKKAVQYLQQSAGTLEFLASQLQEYWGVSEKGAAQLKSLIHLMLAQAQESFVHKAIKGIELLY